MIEKIFIVFVILEAFGLVLHILDSIRCWSDRIYYRKQQEIINASNRESYELSKQQTKLLDDYRRQVAILVSNQTDIGTRLSQVENKLKKPVKKTTKKTSVKKSNYDEQMKDYFSATKAQENGG